MWSHKLGLQITARSFPRIFYPWVSSTKARKVCHQSFRCHLGCDPQSDIECQESSGGTLYNNPYHLLDIKLCKATKQKDQRPDCSLPRKYCPVNSESCPAFWIRPCKHGPSINILAKPFGFMDQTDKNYFNFFTLYNYRLIEIRKINCHTIKLIII